MEARTLAKSQPPPFQLSLRIRHPSLDPAEISRQLRLEPDHSFRAGEPRKSRSGMGPTSVHAETYWLATVDAAPWAADPLAFPERLVKRSFDAAPTNVLDVALTLCARHFLRPHADFVRRIQSDGGQVSLLIAVSPSSLRGFTITPETGHALSELGIGVDFEFMDT